MLRRPRPWWGPIGRAELLGAQSGEETFGVAFVACDRLVDPGALAVGDFLLPAAQDRPDPVERVGLAAAVSTDVYLHTASGLVDGSGAEPDDVEGVGRSRSVLEMVVERVPVAVERIQVATSTPFIESLPRSSSQSLWALPDRPGAGHGVAQPGLRRAVGAGSGVDHSSQLLGLRPESLTGNSLTWCHTC